MATIEEAWASFMREPEVNDYFGGFYQSTIDAARALALTTLDAAENSGCLYPGCAHPCTDCPLAILRAHIETLGS